MSTERIENPHHQAIREPLLHPHPLRPATLASGVALTGLGIVFGLHQLGMIGMGAAPTIGALVLAAAAMLVGVALGWAGAERSGTSGPGPDVPESTPQTDASGESKLG